MHEEDFFKIAEAFKQTQLTLDMTPYNTKRMVSETRKSGSSEAGKNNFRPIDQCIAQS